MEYQWKEDSYDDYRKYSASVLQTQYSTGNRVKGYVADSREENEKLAPVETMRMKNKDGMLSVGINRKSEATFAITSDKPNSLLRYDRTNITMERSRRVNENPDKVYTNTHNEKISGVVYQEELSKSPQNMVGTLKKAVEELDNDVVQAVTPFFLTGRDKVLKKELEDQLRSNLGQRQKEQYELNKSEADKINRRIAYKEREEQRLIHNLTFAKEKMIQQAEHLELEYRRIFYEIAVQVNAEGENKDDSKEDSDGIGEKHGTDNQKIDIGAG